MRLIKVNVPEGYGRSVMETAFSVKIAKVTIHNAENHLPNGNVEPREIIDIEASTPKAKRFMDRMLQSDYFDRQRFSVALQSPAALGRRNSRCDALCRRRAGGIAQRPASVSAGERMALHAAQAVRGQL